MRERVIPDSINHLLLQPPSSSCGGVLNYESNKQLSQAQRHQQTAEMVLTRKDGETENLNIHITKERETETMTVRKTYPGHRDCPFPFCTA
jgi:hypothetical protein